MDQLRQSSRNFWLCVGASSAVVLLTIASACSTKSDRSEIDSYQSAVTIQTKEEALKFIDAFGTSHLVGDLIASLPPDVALQVCAELSSSAAGNAGRSCEVLRQIATIAPAAASTPPHIKVTASPQVPPVTANSTLQPPSKPNQIAVTVPETKQAPPADVHTEIALEAASSQTVVVSAAGEPESEVSPAKVDSTVQPKETGSTTTTAEPPVSPTGTLGEAVVEVAENKGGTGPKWLEYAEANNASQDAAAAAKAAAKAQAAARAKAAAEAKAKAAAERRKEKGGTASNAGGGKRDSKN